MSNELATQVYNSVWLVPFCPFIAFLLILITIRNRSLSGFISITGILISAIISGAMLFARISHYHDAPYLFELDWITIGKTTLNIGVLVNNLSAAMMFVVSFVALLIQIYSWGYMENEEETGFSKYYAYMSLFAASMLGLVLSPNFFQIYIFWELVGLCSYLLIGFWYKKKSASDAAKKAFVVTRFGDLGFLMGIILLFKITGTFSFQEIPGALTQIIQTQPALSNLIPGYLLNTEAVINVVIFLVFCGAIGKSAMFPLHVWLPDAMEGPTPVSALIHAATMVAAGVFMIAQTMEIFKHAPNTMLLIATIGGFTAFIAATMGVVQDDIKRVLAYSTISQLGYMVLALGVGGYAAGVIHLEGAMHGIPAAELHEKLGIGENAGYIAGTFHLITHAFFKALLFLCAGSAIHALHTNSIWEMGRLSKKMKVTSLTFLIGALALAGFPGLSGFWSKDEILATVSHAAFDTFWFFKIVGFTVVFLTTFYMARVYFVAFHPTSKDRSSHEPHESPPVMTVPLIILAVFAALLGFVGTPWNNMFATFITGEAQIGHEINWGLMGLSTIIFLLGAGAAYALYGTNADRGEEILKSYKTIHNILINKYYMDDLWCFFLRKIVYTTGKIMSFIDEKIVDGMVNAVGWITDELGNLIRREETGQVQHYAIIIILSFVIILVGLVILGRAYNQSIVSHLQMFFN